jgi:hypothetical protein
MPDVEGGVRTFLRANAGVAAIVGQRVFFGVPKGATEATFPLVTVSRVGGGDDFSDVPIDVALVQIDCWGGIDDLGQRQEGRGRVAAQRGPQRLPRHPRAHRPQQFCRCRRHLRAVRGLAARSSQRPPALLGDRRGHRNLNLTKGAMTWPVEATPQM